MNLNDILNEADEEKIRIVLLSDSIKIYINNTHLEQSKPHITGAVLRSISQGKNLDPDQREKFYAEEDYQQDKVKEFNQEINQLYDAFLTLVNAKLSILVDDFTEHFENKIKQIKNDNGLS